MKEILTIKKFGPISNVTIHLNRVNVIIGNQSTGKSTIAKLIDIFKSEEFLISKTTVEKIKIFGLYGLGFHFYPDSYLHYESKEYKVRFSSEKFSVVMSKKLKPLVESYRKLDLELKKGTDKITDIFNQRSQISSLIARIKKEAIYFPTERMFLSSLPRISSVKNDRQVSLPEYIMDFRLQFESSRSQLNTLKIDFLKIEFQHNQKQGIDFISIEGKKQIPLQQAASGLQSLIPLYVVLEKQSSSADLEGIFLIEEPESNLFPVSQYEVVKYITAKCLQYDDSFLLTTHSPYILTSLNNLMYAWKVGNMKNEKNRIKVSKIIEEKYWVNPKDVNAYLLKYDSENGGIVEESILDSEGLIQVQKIDGISGVLNAEFDKLMNVELNLA